MGPLLELALADENISPEEVELLDIAAATFKVKSTYNDEGREHYQTREIEFAKILNVDIDAPFTEIKARYRKLIASNHPDKVAGLSDAIKKAAKNETKRIIEAYKFFKERHNNS